MAGARHGSVAQSARSVAGSDAEAFVELLHTRCRAEGIAWMYRVPTPTKVVGKPAPGAAVLPMVFTKPATVDYIGHASKRFAGRSIFVEVKHLAKSTASLHASRIEPHQAEALEISAREGGLAVLLVVANGRPSAIPWSWIRNNVTSTSLDDECLERWICDDVKPYLLALLEAF